MESSRFVEKLKYGLIDGRCNLTRGVGGIFVRSSRVDDMSFPKSATFVGAEEGLHCFWSSGIHLIVLPNHRVGSEVSVNAKQQPTRRCARKPPLKKKHRNEASVRIPPRSPCFSPKIAHARLGARLSEPPGLTLGLEKAENVVLANCVLVLASWVPVPSFIFRCRFVPGPLTLRMMERVVSSMNSTRTWVTPPREPEHIR